jgi:hypothetical protein
VRGVPLTCRPSPICNNSISVVRHMKWIPVGPCLLTMMTAAAVVPLLPLVLFKYPVTELARKFLARLIGL